MEAEKTRYLIANERQKVIEKEAETSRKQNIIKAQSESEVSIIIKEKEINEQESTKKIQEIESKNLSYNFRSNLFGETKGLY